MSCNMISFFLLLYIRIFYKLQCEIKAGIARGLSISCCQVQSMAMVAILSHTCCYNCYQRYRENEGLLQTRLSSNPCRNSALTSPNMDIYDRCGRRMDRVSKPHKCWRS